ncbi:MAG TPA: GtrA family protein [Cyclobacteriaceae bacterium]|nr:GtrA family protein [Cyclobacteriaceae bacterium]
MIKKILSHSFIRFLVVGGLNTAFGYLIFAFFTYVIGNAYASLVLSTITSILFNFKTYGTIVFKSHDNSLIFRFFGAYLFIIGLQMLGLKWLSSIGVTNPYLAVAILVPFMATLSFVLLRKFVFHQSLVPPEPAGEEKAE